MRDLKQREFLGIIEGFYGKPWGFATREALIPFMKQYGYSFYLYAPKADSYLRENWHEPMPEALEIKLRALGVKPFVLKVLLGGWVLVPSNCTRILVKLRRRP